MTFDQAAVERLAQLARLELPPGRAASLAAELSRVVEYVEALDALDLGGDVPGAVVVGGRRADVVSPLDPGARALDTAPGFDGHAVRLPTVVEQA